MSTTETLRFLVSCRHCHRPVMTIAWTPGQLTELARHIRRCAPEAVGDDPGAEETLRQFRIVPVQQD
jgi:hypothetical protein